MVRESVLVSLAILNTNWEERRRSYLDNFVPFIADCLQHLPRREVSAAELRECATERFGLALPYGATESILRRAARDNLVSRSRGIFVRNDAVLSKFDISSIRDDTRRQYEALLDRFVGHVKDILGKELSREDAETSLLEYVESRSLPILAAIVRGESEELQDLTEADENYLVSHFVAFLAERDPEGFSFLETVVKGSMLASALYFPEPGSVGGMFTDLTAYLDTPFIIRALGYGGEPLEEASRELLEGLKSLGARIACWRHTVDETRGVFEACVGFLRSGRSREAVMPMVEFCLQNRIGPSQIEARIERLEDALEGLDIEVENVPAYHAAVSVDEDKFEKILQKRVNYRRAEARVKDVGSVTAIFRKRGGRPQRKIENARALFVTTNPRLVMATRQFFKEDVGQHEVPLCLLDHELATVTWLKRPTQAPDLPRKQILADCYAALYPSDELWRKYLDEVERLRADEKLSEDDYFILRYSVDARRALMHQTLGSSTAFSVGTIDEVLERARRTAQAEVLREAARAAEREDAQSEARERESIAHRKSLEDYEAQLLELKEQREEDRRATERRLRDTAVRQAHVVARLVSAFLALVAALALLSALPFPFSNLVRGAPRWIVLVLSVLGLIALALGFFNTWIGVSIRDLAGAVEGRLASWLESRLRRKFLPPRAP